MLGSETAAALWGAVILSGLYHGLNPGMGWPLAVSSAMMEHRRSSLPRAIAALGAGHFVAMVAILVPFSMLTLLVEWEQAIRISAGVLVVGIGTYLLVTRKHPRFLSRVPPNRLALWSFLIALAHGAALMLVPIYLGLCTDPASEGAGHAAAAQLMGSNVLQAVCVAGVRTLAMVSAGALAAAAVYFWLGLKALSLGWFNLEKLWALSLVGVGALSISLAA